MNTKLLALVKDFNKIKYYENDSYFQPLAYKINFSFKLSEYKEALVKYKNKRYVGEFLKIIIHEYLHFFQRYFTSFGYYSSLLEQFSEAIPIKLIKYIYSKDQNTILNCPINNLIESKKDFVNDNYITKLLFNWFDSDLVYTYLICEYNDFVRKQEILNSIRNHLPLISSNFRTVDKELFEYLVISKRISNNASPPNFNLNFNLNKNLAAEGYNIQNKAFRFFTINGIIESFSKASELFLDPTILSFTQLKSLPISSELYDYLFLLAYSANYVPASNISEFTLTYMAICDIALSPPILPFLAPLRKDNSIEDFDPCFRLFRIISIVNDIKPIKPQNGDYNRFINDVCNALNWSIPLAIAEMTINNLNVMDGDIESHLFLTSQKNRLKGLNIFENLESFLLYLEENLVYCPLTEFSDNLLVNHFLNKEFSFTQIYCIFTYLSKQLWNCLLTHFPKYLYFPYKTDEHMLQTYSNWFCEDFKKLHNLQLSNIKLIYKRI